MAAPPKDGAISSPCLPLQFASIQSGYVKRAFDEFSSAFAEKWSDESLQKFEALGATIHHIGAAERMREILPIERCQHWTRLKTPSEYARHAVHWAVDLAEGDRIFADARGSDIRLLMRLGESVSEEKRKRSANLVTAAEFNLPALLRNLRRVDADMRGGFLREMSGLIDELFPGEEKAMQQPTAVGLVESISAVKNVAELANVLEPLRKRFRDHEVLADRIDLYATIEAAMRRFGLMTPSPPIQGALPPWIVWGNGAEEKLRRRAEIEDSTRMMLAQAYATCKASLSAQQFDQLDESTTRVESENTSNSQQNREHGAAPQTESSRCAPKPDCQPELESNADFDTAVILPFIIDENTFTASIGEKKLVFSARQKLLFDLLCRVSERPGHRVQFETLKQRGNVWDGSRVSDDTIKSAVARLKRTLLKSQLAELVNDIHTGSHKGRQHVVCNTQLKVQLKLHLNSHSESS